MIELNTSLSPQTPLLQFEGQNVQVDCVSDNELRTPGGTFTGITEVGEKPFVTLQKDNGVQFIDFERVSVLTFEQALSRLLPESPAAYQSLEKLKGKAVSTDVASGDQVRCPSGTYQGVVQIEGKDFVVLNRSDKTSFVSFQGISSMDFAEN